jgi:hypothetical protein
MLWWISNMKIIGVCGVGAFFLFHDDMNWSQWVGFGFIFISLLFTCLEKKIRYQEGKGKEAASHQIAAVRDSVSHLSRMGSPSFMTYSPKSWTNTLQMNDEDFSTKPHYSTPVHSLFILQ